MATLFATATGADTVVTIPAPTTPWHHIVLGGLAVSYSGSVQTGRLLVTSGPTLVLDVDIGQEGPAGLGFLRGEAGQPVEIRLVSGGGSVTGKINLLGYREE